MKTLLSAFFMVTVLLFSSADAAPKQSNAPHLAHVKKITSHCEDTLGEVDSTLKFNLTTGAPLTVLIIKPNSSRNFYTLVTAGVSQLKNPNVPTKNLDHEFVIAMPASWTPPMDKRDFVDNQQQIDMLAFFMLQSLATYPVLEGIDIEYNHTISYPYVDLLGHGDLKHVLLAKTPDLPPQFASMDDGGKRLIEFMGVYPISQSEFEIKRQTSAHGLMQALRLAGVTLVFKPKRMILPH